MTDLWRIIGEMQSTDEMELERMAENVYNQAIKDALKALKKIIPEHWPVSDGIKKQLKGLKYKQ